MNITERATPLPEHPLIGGEGGHDAIAAQLLANPKPDASTGKRLTIGEAAKAVGAWEDSSGYVCFGSWMAVRAFAMKMQRDLAMAHYAAPPAYPALGQPE